MIFSEINGIIKLFFEEIVDFHLLFVSYLNVLLIVVYEKYRKFH